MDKSALEMRGIEKNFPGVRALKNVDFIVEKGEIHALIGENGAGKSTLMNVLMGNHKLDGGTIAIDGKGCHIDGPASAIHHGIGMVPQELSLVPHATVAENLFLGNENKGKLGAIDWRRTEESARKFLEKLGVEVDVRKKAHQLSTAYQQLIQIARTLAMEPNILILDEPTAALTGKEVDLLFSILRQLKKEGKSIIFVSHRLEELKAIADGITIMRDGQVVHVDQIANLSIEQIIAHMANREARILQSERRTLSEELLLSVRNFSRAGEFKDVSFDVRKGEIFGIGGLVGAKRTELVSAVFGLTKKDNGTIAYRGKSVEIKTPRKAIELGIGYVPEERRRDGIFPILDVGENITIALYGRTSGLFGIKYSKTRSVVDEFIAKLKIKTTSSRVAIKNLSGGNQQKAILSRWLARDVELLILDEPTRGIDVNAKFEIYQLIRKMSEQGMTVIIVSSEHKELLTLCDRIMVMHEGRVKGFLDPSASTEEDILKTALMN